jgi:hypothetical protein
LDQCQNIIVQAASLSCYFWPTRKDRIHKNRGEALRLLFQMSEESSLKSRSIRNAISHFDERLDSYLEKEIFGYILPEYVGVTPDEEVPHHLFRAYFIDSGVFSILGDECEIMPILEEVYRIHSVLNQLDSNGGRLKE